MLKARDIWDEQEYRHEQRMAAMRPVMAQIHGRIRKQAITNPNAPYIVFEVPSYVFGYPLFKVADAINYLHRELTTSGFQVWVTDEKYLLISWLKTGGGKASAYRPPLTTNYRPQIYDPVVLGSMLR
jgi:hypothetical protein